MKAPFEILDHTADVGIRAHGASPAEVYENVARGLLSLMAEAASVRLEREVVLEVEGADAVDLLVAWLHEILYRFDTRGEVFGAVRVDAFSEWRLRARLQGETLDTARHALGTEVKAVTWHGARVARDEDGWVAEVFLDV